MGANITIKLEELKLETLKCIDDLSGVGMNASVYKLSSLKAAFALWSAET